MIKIRVQSKSHISQFTSLLHPVRGREERSHMMTKDKKVEHINQIDMSNLKFPTFAVYQNPKDYPGRCVARLFEGERPTNIVIIRKRAHELHQLFRNETRMMFLPKLPGDPENLVGVWM